MQHAPGWLQGQAAVPGCIPDIPVPSAAGVEALFADLGHFSRAAIQIGILCVVYPSLIVTYLGQAAYLTVGTPEFLDSLMRAQHVFRSSAGLPLRCRCTPPVAYPVQVHPEDVSVTFYKALPGWWATPLSPRGQPGHKLHASVAHVAP